jgi:hypothetical protein
MTGHANQFHHQLSGAQFEIVATKIVVPAATIH